MQFHRNAKLGLAGRQQLVLAIESGGSIRQSARTFNVSVATAQSLLEAVARCRGWRRGEPLLPFRSLESTGAQSAAARARARAGDLRLSAADGLGAEARRRRDRVRALDRLEGAEAAPAAPGHRRSLREPAQPLPVALPWRPAAHGLRVSTPASNGLDTASAASAAHKTATIWTASTSCTPSSTITLASPTRRSTTMSVRPRPQASSSAPSPSTRGHGSIVKRVLTDNAWAYTRSRVFSQLLARARDRALHQQALPPP